jgi:hypothetical protein
MELIFSGESLDGKSGMCQRAMEFCWENWDLKRC